MQGIYTWAISFTACSFTVLIINYLFPKGNVKNTATVVLVLYCLVSIIGPVKEIKSINMFESSETVIENEANATVTAAKTRIRLLTDEALKSVEINNYELELNISVKDEQLQIDGFSVYIENPQLIQKAKQAIFEKTGIEPDIYSLEQE